MSQEIYSTSIVYLKLNSRRGHMYYKKSLCLQGDSSNAYPGKCFVQLIFAAGKNLFIASSTSRADRYLTLDQPKFSIEPFEHH